MIEIGRSVELVLASPLLRSHDLETYAFTGTFAGFVEQNGTWFVHLQGTGDDFTFIPVALVGAILADGERAAQR